MVLRKWPSFPQGERGVRGAGSTHLSLLFLVFLYFCLSFPLSISDLFSFPASLCVAPFSFLWFKFLLFAFSVSLFSLGQSKSPPIPPSPHPHPHPTPPPALSSVSAPPPILSFLPPPGFKDDQPLRVLSFRICFEPLGPPTSQAWVRLTLRKGQGGGVAGKRGRCYTFGLLFCPSFWRGQVKKTTTRNLKLPLLSCPTCN